MYVPIGIFLGRGMNFEGDENGTETIVGYTTEKKVGKSIIKQFVLKE